MGFDESEVRRRNKRIIYVSISGFGDKGPYAHKRVYDPVIQALSGLADVQMEHYVSGIQPRRGAAVGTHAGLRLGHPDRDRGHGTDPVCGVGQHHQNVRERGQPNCGVLQRQVHERHVASFSRLLGARQRVGERFQRVHPARRA